jgi:hypothetical protein
LLDLRTGSNCALAALQPSPKPDLSEFTGVPVDARQVERVVQRVEQAVESWREQLPPARPALPPGTLYFSYDMTGVPMRSEELRGRKGKQPDGSANSREVSWDASRHVLTAPLRQCLISGGWT